MAFSDHSGALKGIQLLQKSLATGRLGHAYLFTGSSVDTLESIARTLAKVLNCANPPSRNPAGMPLDSCDHCSSCRRIEEGLHPDIQWIRPESKSRIITIDQIRELIQTINLKPSEASFKVGVIVSADRMRHEAANAFLKTLEEPPARSILILLSNDPDRLLETILSRCLKLNFPASDDSFESSPNLPWLTKTVEMVAPGSKSFLDRYRILGSITRRLAETRESIETRLAAESPLAKFEDADSKLKEKWEDELKASIEAEYRLKRLELMATLQSWLRDVWILSIQSESASLHFPSLQAASNQVARRVGPEKSLQNLETLERTQRLLYTNVQEALALEVALLKLHF